MSKDVEGVYEMNIPGDFRSLLKLGACVKPNFKQIGLRDSALSRVYSLKEFDQVEGGVSEFNLGLIQSFTLYHVH